ncbi:MAG: ESPR domain-containing protein [Acidithiobacillus sp.]|nr:ESPR domain-containing protein [Acidithiobacillus sp.]
MNATYRLIFNRAPGCLQTASELAKAGGAAGGVVGADGHVAKFVPDELARTIAKAIAAHGLVGITQKEFGRQPSRIFSLLSQ